MSLWQSRVRRIGLIASAALLVSAGVPAMAKIDKHETRQPLPPGVSTGSCVETGMNYSVSTDLQVTSSKQYRDIGGTSVSFTQGASGCVEVSFSAEGATYPSEILVTRALLDNTACLPDANFFASDSPTGDLADHAMNYICPNVAAGNHTVKMQFRSRFGRKVAIDFRTTVVRYAK